MSEAISTKARLPEKPGQRARTAFMMAQNKGLTLDKAWAAVETAIYEDAAKCAEDFMRSGERMWRDEPDADKGALHLAQAYGAKSVSSAIRAKIGEAK